MPTIADILNARRQQSIFDRVASGSSSTATPPSVFDRLSPSSPMQGITLGSILERGGQTLGRLGREVPNEIAANYADMVEAVRNNPGAFGPAALPITLANLARGYQQGQEREARGGEPSLTETPFATHTSGDPTVKGAAMVADPGNVVGTGVGAKVATGLAKLLGGAKGVNQALIAFHGSPHKFDKFDMSKIGTGEGAQAYGHGLYFAERPGVAGSYRNPTGLMEHRATGEVTDSRNIPMGKMPEYGPVKGSLYKVDLPDEQIAKMLDWDKPLSQQPESVQKLFASVERLKDPYIRGKVTTGEALAELSGHLGGRPQAAQYLREQGIPGIRYLDQGSRAGGKGTSNFVVFSDDIPKILSRE